MTAYPHHLLIWPGGSRPRIDHRGLAWAAFVGGSLVVLFWAVYWAAGPAVHGEVAAYESAFPLADAVFALTLFAAGTALRRGAVGGPFLLVVAASMSLYLGIVDATFYTTRGDYSPPEGAALVELVTNVLCVTGGALGLAFGWRIWRRSSETR